MTFAAPLPEGVKAVWETARAWREKTPTRERVSLNGLWRWQPAAESAAPAAGGEAVPTHGWGYFKVPGPWPGITDYLQKDCQTVFAHPSWLERSLRGVSAAWYERTIDVPSDWAGRRITASFEYLNSYASVFLDGHRVGEARFPGGEVDLSAACRPGESHRLSLLVWALPLEGVLRSYTDTAAARETKGEVARRGLCGDAFLVATPTGPRIAEVQIDTSVRRKQLTVRAAVEGLGESDRWRLRVRATGPGTETREFSSLPFGRGDLAEDRWLTAAESWLPSRLWDLHTPENLGELQVSLAGAEDAAPVQDVFWKERFGFREFRIEGRDFHLNGTRVFLSAVPLDNAQVGAAWATYDAARESLERLRRFGIDFVYTHNYGCEPGSHLGFREILRAADDVGMLVALSQPHFSHYRWSSPEADRTNGYARHAAFYARAAGNHPSVVAYATSHNATGYHEDMNPDLIDGTHAVRDEWASRNARLAARAEALVSAQDPRRIVYHHASGNLGPVHAINFYPNFVPIQELSDWFEHWSTAGVKPAYLCEYGAPFTWDWTMYRGWYLGQREFGSARVPWEFCVAEWNAQFLGDRAFPASETEQANLRWEARQFREGRLWHRWDYPAPVGSPRFDERYPVFAAYLTDNWRAFRTWEVSAISPWEYEHFWRLRPGVDRGRKMLPVDWENLQRPGFSADYLDARYERVDLAYGRDDWMATPASEALERNNRPLLGWIAGKPSGFTSKDHVFAPGETVEKQLVVINDSRRTTEVEATWSFDGLPAARGRRSLRLETGRQQRLPVQFALPADSPPGRRSLHAAFRFGNDEVQEDRFDILVLAAPAPVAQDRRIAVFDPAGETRAWLERLGLATVRVDPGQPLPACDLLVVGRRALAVDGPAPEIARVGDGLKVVMFEQTAEVLERRFGFRVAEYGLRQAFARIPDHPVVAGLVPDHLRDWRGEATLLPSRLKYEMRPRHGPTVRWCDIPVTRVWRCGNRGTVASVSVEKPARGDFLPILEGGYNLQYSPLLEFREGRGAVFLCQLDVTGRSEADPVAETIARNLLRYAAAWTPAPRTEAVYLGEDAGRRHLASLGITPAPLAATLPPEGRLLVLGPGCGAPPAVTSWMQTGGRVLALGLDGADLAALPGLTATVAPAEHLSTGFAPFGLDSPFAGIGPADLHSRDPRTLPLVEGGARRYGNGCLAEGGRVAYFQPTPWRFAETNLMNVKRTWRRLSFALSRLLANHGVAGPTPFLERFSRGVDPAAAERRWEEGFYLDRPEEWDDPYRFFRW
ncbi:MAG: hypothetical protein J0M00_03205 [Burkholderiales bacterium]|nr:hypothetical protein [Burkholderiales bacterium]